MHKPSEITEHVQQAIEASGLNGLTTPEVVSAIGLEHAQRVHKALWNLCQRGRLVSEKQTRHGSRGQAPARWFCTSIYFSEEEALIAEQLNDAKLNTQLRRARALDLQQPLQHYGSGLTAPGCNSVWTYAQHFGEHAHA